MLKYGLGQENDRDLVQNFHIFETKKVEILCFFFPEVYNFSLKLSFGNLLLNPWNHHVMKNGPHKKFDSFRHALSDKKYVLFGRKFTWSNWIEF